MQSQNDISQPVKQTRMLPETNLSTLNQSTGLGESVQIHCCYLINKSSQLASYTLELSSSFITVLSNNNNKVKAELQLNPLHAREMPLIPKKNLQAEGEASEDGYWYPLKLSSPQNHYRVLYLETQKLRSTLLQATLTAQGYANQLE